MNRGGGITEVRQLHKIGRSVDTWQGGFAGLTNQVLEGTTSKPEFPQSRTPPHQSDIGRTTVNIASEANHPALSDWHLTGIYIRLALRFAEDDSDDFGNREARVRRALNGSSSICEHETRAVNFFSGT